MSGDFLPQLRPVARLESGDVRVALLKGRAGVEVAVWPSLMYAQRSCLDAFNLLHRASADPLAALVFEGGAAHWSASLLVSPQMAFLSPVPEAHMPLVARTMHDRVVMENDWGLRIVTEAGQALQLAKVWAALTQQPVETISRFDQYHCPQAMTLPGAATNRIPVTIELAGAADVPLLFEHENFLRAGVFSRLPRWMEFTEREHLLRDMEGRPRYLCRDEAGRVDGHFITVPLGHKGSYIAGYFEPHRLFSPAGSGAVVEAQIAALTRHLQSEGRWVSLLSAPTVSHSPLAQVAERLGFSKAGQMHCGFYPFARGKMLLTPR